MSSFVHPALFWGGLGLVSIPLIIHLLNRRRFRRIEWAAMEFLLDALRRNRRRIRIEQIILLLVRMAVVFFLVGALARPHLSQSDYAWMSGPFRSEEKVFLLDDSLSMGQVEAGRSSLRRGLDALLAATKRVALDGGRDPVSILRTSSFEAPLFNAVNLDSERFTDVREFLEGRTLEATAVRMDLAAALENLASHGRSERGRSISIITDLCRADWLEESGELRPELHQALEHLKGGEDDRTRVLVLDVGAAKRDNLSIDALTLDVAHPIVGIPFDLHIEVSLHGNRAVRGLGTRLRTSESVAPGPRIESVRPGETVKIKVPHVFHQAGPAWVRAELDGPGAADGLLADNQRDLVVEVREAVDVLVVDGEPSGVFGEGESDFLLQALRPPGEVRSGFAPTVVVTSNLPQDPLERFGVIVLANVGRLPSEFTARLGKYVRNGGGLVVFPGDQVDSSGTLRSLGVGTPENPGPDLLPAVLGEITGDPTRPAHLTPQFDHPAFRLLSGAGDELFRLVDVARFFQLQVPDTSRVIATLSDADSSAFLVERKIGDGQVVLCAAPADLEWSNWPRNPTFLPVVLELLGSLSRRRGTDSNRLAGAPIELPIDLARHQRKVRWRDPDYPQTPEKGILAADDPDRGEDSSGGYRFVLDDTRRAGVHTLILRSVSGEDEQRLLAVAADPLESDLGAVDSEELEERLDGLGVTVVRNADAFLQSGPGRFEIADALLIALVCFFFIESLLAWFFGHHSRPQGETRASASGGAAIPLARRPGGAR